MGNRGGPISDIPDRKQYSSVHWIYCKLAFNGRQFTFRNPGRKYTELFFFDEGVALAAGHRPCGQCQYQRLGEYKAAAFDRTVFVEEVDAVLHRERTELVYAEVASLPAGTFVQHEGADLLLWSGAAFLWEPSRGYSEVALPAASARVRVYTPQLTRRALAAGFAVHPRLDLGRVSDPGIEVLTQSPVAPQKVRR
ncbi:hypothetical protein F3087_26820 [Nocardia colli]|uniref:Ada DNA repair metal-binding domain-containing protein n=1 Tax=Nocardia colli TaxID=2545717 RepID=A0A5N0EDI9_9NOCA|nr:hypothetical protein [Nocardia colli]KAA8886205.1 hypothetical protein F3087_26820 [Nocardia colli]